MIFDARKLARGWLSVAVASGKDKWRPQLNRTMSIESFPDGVRLVATDSYMLLHSWVPSIEDEDAPEPGVDESPVATAVAIDTHGRAAGFLAHLLVLAKADNAPLYEVRLTLGVVEPEDEDAQVLGGMEARWVVIEQPDVERLKLLTYEGPYPNWRKVLSGFNAKKTTAVALNSAFLGRLGTLGKINDNAPVLWHFGGPDKMALLEVAESDPHVGGALMPVRWDFDRDAPRVDTKDEPEDDDEA